MKDFRYHILEILIDEIGSEDIDESVLEIPPNPEMGDYAYPCFLLSKKLKKSPPQVAEYLAKKLKPNNFVSKIKNTGPYLNFFVNKVKFAEGVLHSILESKKDYGRGSKTRTMMIEYPSPNTNKPLHLGHIRNMLLGSSVGKILAFNGDKVIKVNLNNDRGVHICKSMLAYKLFGNNAEPDMKSDHFVGKWYVKFNEQAKENPELDKQALEMLKKWEAKDPETIELWKKMNKWAFSGFDETYKKLGISFDKQYYESTIFDKGKKIILKALESGILEKDEEGNIMANLEEWKLNKKIVLRADGTAVYSTQDISLAMQKFEDFPDINKSIYVVASEQNYYFSQLFKILKILNFEFAKKCFHLSYGMVFLPEGKMKSREGTVVDADDLIDEVIALAKAEIELRHKDLSDKEVLTRAKSIGVGALRFYMLKTDLIKDMTYDPKESVSFEGETGPYVQYAHARICGIKKKYKDFNSLEKGKIDYSLLNTPEETELIKTLGSFNIIVESAADHYRPSTISHYSIKLAQKFNEFYHKHKVIDPDAPELTAARIVLCECIRQVIENSLSLLCIDVLEEM